MLKTYLVSNYPGVAEIPGPDLGMTMYEQSLAFGAAYIPGWSARFCQTGR